MPDSFKNMPMAPVDAAKVAEGEPPVRDTKPSSNHLENTEAGIKLNQFDGERVIVTEQDVSPSPQCPFEVEVISPTNGCQQNKIILRKTDKTILTILVWVYFLQVSIILFSLSPTAY